MKRLTLCLAAGLMAIGIAAGAQAPAGPRQAARQARLGVADVPLVVLERVVKLTAEQKAKLEPIYTKLAEDRKALQPVRGAAPDPTAAQKRRDLTRAANTQIQAILTTEQKESLKKAAPELLMLRSAGVPLVVLEQLKLTDDQKTKIKAIVDDVLAKVKDLTPEERRAKQRELMTEARAKVADILTADQKAIIQKAMKARGRRAPSRP